MKPAEVRFYIDQDLLGLAKVLASLREDVTYPGDTGAKIHRRERPACTIAPGTRDREWIPVVTADGSSSPVTATSRATVRRSMP